MSIRGVGSTAAMTTERSSTRVEDTTNADAFAGMFTSAVSTTRQIEKVRVRHEGTSELDKTHGTEDGTDRDDEDKDDKKTRTRVRVAHHSSTQDVIKSVDALDPELQDKLARVMSRMQDEAGQNVTVNETLRTQDRQNALFAQGRQTAGEVVTWTQNSKHTQGRAVDVTVDGGGAEAYQTLQRIASEEGLRTLGAIDPGHLELKGSGAKLDASAFAPVATDATTQQQNPTTIARVADVAKLADVARVADVGAVAQPSAGRPVQTAPMTASAQVMANAASIKAAAAKGSNGSDSSAFEQGSQKDSSSANSGSSNGYAAFGQGISMRDHSSFSMPSVGSVAGSEAAARAEKLAAVMDATPARQLSSLTMSVDNANGTSDKIQLTMRGSSLDTTIATSDNRVAQLLNAKSDELSKALSKDGIELRELRVRAATDTNTVTAAQHASQSNAQNSNDASSQSRSDRGQPWQRQQDHQEQQDQYDRQRSQQQQQRGRQQRQGRGDNQ